VFVVLLAPSVSNSHDVSSLVWATLGSAGVILIGVLVVLGGLSHDGLERVGRLMHYVQQGAWLMSTIMAIVLSVISCILLAVAWSEIDKVAAEARIQFFGSLFVTLALAIVFAMLTTTSMPPILTVKSHRLQIGAGIWGAIVWTISASSLLFTIAMAFSMTSASVLFPPALFLGVITSLVVFVPNRAWRLSTWRRSILDAVTDALAAAEGAHAQPNDRGHHRALAASLRRVVNELSTDSFVGMFPFATQQRADGEIITVIEFAESRLIDSAPPSAVARFDSVFAPYIGATQADIVSVTERALLELRERLLDRSPSVASRRVRKRELKI